MVEVADTEPGIPLEFQEKMFGPIEQFEGIDRKHNQGSRCRSRSCLMEFHTMISM
jgi:hypothetical protein